MSSTLVVRGSNDEADAFTPAPRYGRHHLGNKDVSRRRDLDFDFSYFIVLSNLQATSSNEMSEELPPGAGPPQQVTTEDVVSLARAAIGASRDASRRADDTSTSGITVDLTHKNITRLPDEVIDIIKDEIGRSVGAISLLS